ncbi:MAG: Crp/Fnr family transcriptional regulator [Desulfobulbaceae bacterium]|nr:Crp/Fnr family transcriptional regulator [Desulfobulbaceae bacterium]
MKIVEALAAIPLFQGMNSEQLQKLALIVADQRYSRGQAIFAEGDAGVGFYVVISGKVKIFKLSSEGKEQILHVFGSGEPFAEAAVFAGSCFPAHAMALETSRIFFFPRLKFTLLIQENPALAMNMMAALSMRLKKFASLIESLSLKEVPGRLAVHLLLLAEEQERDEVRLDLTKSHLASLLGTIPETLSRILTKMTKADMIATNGPSITLLNRDALEALASGEERL